MTPIQERVVAARAAAVREMVQLMGTLPLESLASFTADVRMVAAGESFLRRALEALLDLGRHVLAKGFGMPVAEYGAVGKALGRVGALPPALAALVQRMGRYRNRLTHGYQEVTAEERYALVAIRLHEILAVLEAMLAWVREHPELVERGL